MAKFFKGVPAEQRPDGAWVKVSKEEPRRWYPKDMIDKIEVVASASSEKDVTIAALKEENRQLKERIAALESEVKLSRQNAQVFGAERAAALKEAELQKMRTVEAKSQAGRIASERDQAERAVIQANANAAYQETKANIAQSAANAANANAEQVQRESDTRAVNSYINGLKDGAEIKR